MKKRMRQVFSRMNNKYVGHSLYRKDDPNKQWFIYETARLVFGTRVRWTRTEEEAVIKWLLARGRK